MQDNSLSERNQTPDSPAPPRRSVLLRVSSFIDRIVSAYGRAMYRLVRYGVPILIFFIGIAFTIRVFVDLRADTVAATNAAFAFLASLAAITFSFARSIEDNAALKDRISYSAERFLHAALLTFSASALKYGWLWILQSGVLASIRIAMSIGQTLLGIVIVVLFNQALVFADAGFVRVNETLWTRVARQQDWDDLFAHIRASAS